MLGVFGAVAMSSASAQTYCSPQYSTGCAVGDQIENFSTTGGQQNITNNSSGCSSGNYQYFSNMTVSGQLGDVISFTVQAGSSWSQGHRIWVDWNDDKDFTDPGEDMWNSGTASTAAFTGSFTIPQSAVPGVNLRMRVRCNYASIPSDPCAQQSFGEVEDYNMFVIPPVQNDAGVEAIVSPNVGLCTLGSIETKVILNNFGSGNMTSCTVNWMIGTSTQTPVSFTGNVAALGGTSDTVSLGSFTYSDGDVLTVWTTNPNGVQDSFPSNDSMTVQVFEALGGSYTVGSTSTDFTTIQDAAVALSARGVCSPVTMNLVDNLYNEKVVLGNIPGASMTNYVTFQPDPLNTSIVEISSQPNIDSNFVVNFNGATYVKFDNVTIDGSSGTSYGKTVVFDGAMYSGVSNSIINGLNTQSTSNLLYVVQGNGGMGTFLTKNQVNGGSYSIYWSGGMDIEFFGNDFAEPYYYGVYLSNMDGVKFNKNQLHSSNSYQYAYGLYANTIDNASEFIGNYLDWPGYSGAYFYQLNGRVDAQPIVANNMIRSGNGSYYAYGCYLYNSGYVNFINNTIAKDVGNGYGYYGVYVTGGANKIINNLFYDPNGSSTYYNMYYSGSFAVSESDYNNVWSNQYFGYLNGVQNTLSTWQTNTGFDMNSTTIDPLFPSFDTLRHCNDSLDGTGTPIAFITDDIDGDGRHPSTPDVGADEWVGSAPGSYSAGEDAIVCDGKTVEIGLAVTGGTFLWSTGDTTSTINVANAGSYTVAMTSDCGALHTDTVEVVDVTPTASFTITEPRETFHTIHADNNSVNGDNYMWTVIGTGRNDTLYTMDLTHVVGDNGPYEVCLYTYNDCDTATTCDTWTGVVSIEEIDLSNMIRLMPNPASDFVNFEFSNVEGDVTVEMTNIQGQVVYTERYMDVSGHSMKSVNVSSLKNGMYIVKFMSNNGVATKQLIIK